MRPGQGSRVSLDRIGIDPPPACLSLDYPRRRTLSRARLKDLSSGVAGASWWHRESVPKVCK
jgi:hypothetical protein